MPFLGRPGLGSGGGALGEGTDSEAQQEPLSNKVSDAGRLGGLRGGRGPLTLPPKNTIAANTLTPVLVSETVLTTRLVLGGGGWGFVCVAEQLGPVHSREFVHRFPGHLRSQPCSGAKDKH